MAIYSWHCLPSATRSVRVAGDKTGGILNYPQYQRHKVPNFEWQWKFRGGKMEARESYNCWRNKLWQNKEPASGVLGCYRKDWDGNRNNWDGRTQYNLEQVDGSTDPIFGGTKTNRSVEGTLTAPPYKIIMDKFHSNTVLREQVFSIGKESHICHNAEIIRDVHRTAINVSEYDKIRVRFDRRDH